MNKKICIVACLLTSVSYVYSQSSDSAQEKNSFKVGIEYNSNQTYAGRTDSLRLPVIQPSLQFVTRVGFYIKTSGYLNLSKYNKGFDGVAIEPGYEFSKNNWNGSISLTKNFISDSSNLIVAPIKTSVEIYVGNDNKIISPYIGGEFMSGTEGNDIIFYTGLSKLITLTQGDHEPSVTIDPSLSVTGGTQNFYFSFLKNYAVYGRPKNKSRTTVPMTQTNKKQSEQFNLLSTALEMPITVTKGKFEWTTTPACEVPHNLVDKSGAGVQEAKTVVYFKTGLVYTF